MTGRVSFIGAGPGAADLITVRGARRIAEADIVVWAASLVDPDCIREHARPEAELVDSSLITHEDVIEVYRRAAREGLKVARVHSGDPALWGAVQEQYDSARKLGVEVEIVPGVSAFSAAAAIAGRELTVPEVAQSVILTRLEGGKTPMPDGEHIREFARHGTTMAIFLSAARSGQLVDELRAGGYADDTPVIVAYKATWPDELILHTTIGELSDTVKQHKLWRHTLFLVGKALSAGGTRSHLYHAGHFHTYRKAEPAARRTLRAVGANQPAEVPEPGGEGEQRPARPKGSGWPLQTSRSGWVAARVGNWTQAAVPTGEPGSNAESVAAWSAVHGWQETARSARAAARAKPVRAVRKDQPELELDDSVDAATVIEPDAKPGTVVTAEVTPVSEMPAGESPTSGAGTPEADANAEAAQAKPKPMPRANARKTAAKKAAARKTSAGKPAKANPARTAGRRAPNSGEGPNSGQQPS
ncbi:MAG TPA: precorrin-4 C(11)-methyltransferase [Pseudonocardiaceae bacterium]|nr:precorrin-4 C(11)-methyltransferase [Pseudonocardiaceae bacterium]